MAAPLKGKSHKTNPPYPPLSGGQEKANPSQPGGSALPFYTPLIRGGRGGCLCPLLRGAFSTASLRVGGFFGFDGKYLPFGSVNVVVPVFVDGQALGRLPAEKVEICGVFAHGFGMS